MINDNLIKLVLFTMIKSQSANIQKQFIKSNFIAIPDLIGDLIYILQTIDARSSRA